MANTSAAQMAAGLDGILKYNNGSGSLNFYMAHGGTNFGFWAGAAPCPWQKQDLAYWVTQCTASTCQPTWP